MAHKITTISTDPNYIKELLALHKKYDGKSLVITQSQDVVGEKETELSKVRNRGIVCQVTGIGLEKAVYEKETIETTYSTQLTFRANTRFNGFNVEYLFIGSGKITLVCSSHLPAIPEQHIEVEIQIL